MIPLLISNKYFMQNAHNYYAIFEAMELLLRFTNALVNIQGWLMLITCAVVMLCEQSSLSRIISVCKARNDKHRHTFLTR